jgi:probable addiction module antidote protein
MSKREREIELDDLEGLDSDLEEFDPAQHLTNLDAIAAYMSDIMATGDTALFQSALNDVVRAFGTGKVAKKAGITREGAYKALREGSKPQFATIAHMLDALGLTIKVVPKAGENGDALAA